MAPNQEQKKARCIYICFTITTMIEIFEFSTNRNDNMEIAGDYRLTIFKFWKMRNHRCEFSDSDAVISQHSIHSSKTHHILNNSKAI